MISADLIYSGERIGVIWRHARACSWVITSGMRGGSLDGRAGSASTLTLARDTMLGLMQRRGRIIRRRVRVRYRQNGWQSPPS
jgi:hypothetical protein